MRPSNRTLRSTGECNGNLLRSGRDDGVNPEYTCALLFKRLASEFRIFCDRDAVISDEHTQSDSSFDFGESIGDAQEGFCSDRVPRTPGREQEFTFFPCMTVLP